MLRRIIGFIDWRFLIALCLLAGVAAAVHGSLAAGQERDRVIAAAAVERREASAERDRLLQGQRDLAAKYDRLIRWLNNQHIVVPPEVLNGRTTVRVETDDNDDSSSNDSDDSDDNGTTPQPTKPPARTTSNPPAGGGGGSDQGGSKSGTAATQSRSAESRSAETGSRNPGRGVAR